MHSFDDGAMDTTRCINARDEKMIGSDMNDAIRMLTNLGVLEMYLTTGDACRKCGGGGNEADASCSP